jgi:hypothetical protein
MSIFNAFSSLAWLREKSLNALMSAVLLVDLAKEPDTTDWYRQKLTGIAQQLIANLVPVVGHLHQGNEECISFEQSKLIIDGGSFALGKWCKKWNIADGGKLGSTAVLRVVSADEEKEKAAAIAQAEFEGDTNQALDLKLQIYHGMTWRLLTDNVPQEAQRVLLWLLKSLWTSYPPDVVSISRRFLPTDVGLTPDETSAAYKFLFENHFIERIDDESQDKRKDFLSLRLVVGGVNDSKHTAAYVKESFGYPGARINGEVTCGQTLLLGQKDVPSKFGWCFREGQPVETLKTEIQNELGYSAIFVEDAAIKTIDDKPLIVLHARCPLSADWKVLSSRVKVIVIAWLQKQLDQATP